MDREVLKRRNSQGRLMAGVAESYRSVSYKSHSIEDPRMSRSRSGSDLAMGGVACMHSPRMQRSAASSASLDRLYIVTDRTTAPAVRSESCASLPQGGSPGLERKRPTSPIARSSATFEVHVPYSWGSRNSGTKGESSPRAGCMGRRESKKRSRESVEPAFVRERCSVREVLPASAIEAVCSMKRPRLMRGASHDALECGGSIEAPRSV